MTYSKQQPLNQDYISKITLTRNVLLAFPVEVNLDNQYVLILANEHVEIYRNVKLRFPVIYRLTLNN